MIDKLKKILSTKKDEENSSNDDKKPQVKEVPKKKKRETKVVRVVKKITEPYDFQTFIEAFIYSKQTYVHEDFDKYYDDLLSALEKLFEIELDVPKERGKISLWGLLGSAVYSYLDIKTPMSNYLEAGLLFNHIRESGSEEEIMGGLENLDEQYTAYRNSHRELIVSLFTEIFGESDKVFSSQDLKGIGFDDSTHPDDTDYYDYW